MKKKKKTCSNCNAYWEANSQCVEPTFKCKYYKKQKD